MKQTVEWVAKPSNEGIQELVISDKDKVNVIVRNQRRQSSTQVKYRITIEEITDGIQDNIK
jgi:tetrahydromethanopterin S-methyltransferase subunit F